MNSSLLSHLKIIEFSGIGPSPFAGMMLADLGAEVTLIERINHSSNDKALDTQRQFESYNSSFGVEN